MGRPSGGYTIVEVMIVLAISAVLLTGALVVFHSGQRDTQFSQAMQDISSTIQNYVGQITAGSYPGSENHTCLLVAGRPELGSGATNEACSFLGRAFQIQPTKGIMNSYVILGTRDVYSNGADSGQPALTLNTATPTPAIDSTTPSGSYALVQTYNFEGGVTVKSSTGLPGGAEYDVAGIYNNLVSAANSAYGNQSLNLVGYNFNGQPVQQSGTLTSCIEETTCSAATQVVPLSQWNLCLTDGSAADTASLQIKSSVSGITTKIVYAGC